VQLLPTSVSPPPPLLALLLGVLHFLVEGFFLTLDESRERVHGELLGCV